MVAYKKKTGDKVVKKSNNPAGKPAHRVTKKNKELVYNLHAVDAKSQAFIANALNISVSTLTKYYKDELEEAKKALKEEFTLSGFEMARRALTDPKYIRVYEFVMRTQFGSVERKEVDHKNSDGSLKKRTFIVVSPDAQGELIEGEIVKPKKMKLVGSE